MKKTFTWTTPRGAKIEATFTVEHCTKKTVYADGWNMEVACDEWQRYIDSLTVNGKATEQKDLWWGPNNEPIIIIGKRGKDTLMVAIPSDVDEYLFAEEREAKEKAQREAEIKRLKAQKDAAEKQMVDGKLPTEAEVKVKRRNWINIQNEGGEGYVSTWWSQEQYDSICTRLAELEA